VLEQLTGQQPVFGKARYTVRSFSIRRNEKISTSVTVRGEKALQLIVRPLCCPGWLSGRGVAGASGVSGASGALVSWAAVIWGTAQLLPGRQRVSHATVQEAGLKVKEYELLRRNFSETGNFGFGISEHIDLGIKYDPSTGIYGALAHSLRARQATLQVCADRLCADRRGLCTAEYMVMCCMVLWACEEGGGCGRGARGPCACGPPLEILITPCAPLMRAEAYEPGGTATPSRRSGAGGLHSGPPRSPWAPVQLPSSWLPLGCAVKRKIRSGLGTMCALVRRSAWGLYAGKQPRTCGQQPTRVCSFRAAFVAQALKSASPRWCVMQLQSAWRQQHM
jgi:hypothetical protein